MKCISRKTMWVNPRHVRALSIVQYEEFWRVEVLFSKEHVHHVNYDTREEAEAFVNAIVMAVFTGDAKI